MKSGTVFLTEVPGVFYITVMAIAVGLGVYGVFILIDLAKNANQISKDQVSDRLLIGSFNIAISALSICMILTVIQIDTYLIFTQANQLLQEMK